MRQIKSLRDATGLQNKSLQIACALNGNVTYKKKKELVKRKKEKALPISSFYEVKFSGKSLEMGPF